MPIHPQGLVPRNGRDQFNLVGLAPALVKRNGAGPVPDLGAHRVAQIDDLLHPGLDGAKILGGERNGPVEIVIPAVFNHRADGDFDIRPQLLHRAGHDMGKVVADQFQRRAFVL